jgi:tetratricopeptide (TPR) repeat protein
MILLLLTFSIATRIDSLEKALDQKRQIETVVELTKCYIATGEYHKSIELLRKNERYFPKDVDKSIILYEQGSVFLFAGDIAKAHDAYLGLLSRYPGLDIANDAAARLYMIEIARDDTVGLRRLVNVVRFYETAQYVVAVDSARVLLQSPVGAYAYYYLALTYQGLGDLPLSVGTLEEMNREHPKHRIFEAALLQADVYILLGKSKNAEEVLEDLIVREPNTIYALKARQKLESLKKEQK